MKNLYYHYIFLFSIGIYTLSSLSQEIYDIQPRIRTQNSYYHHKDSEEKYIEHWGFFIKDRIFVVYIENFEKLYSIRYGTHTHLLISQNGKKDISLNLGESYFDLQKGILLVKIPEYEGPFLELDAVEKIKDFYLLYHNKQFQSPYQYIPLKKYKRELLVPFDKDTEGELKLIKSESKIKPIKRKQPKLTVVNFSPQEHKTISHSFVALENPTDSPNEDEWNAFASAKGLPILDSSHKIVHGIFTDPTDGNYLYVLDGSALQDTIRNSKNKFQEYHESQLNKNYVFVPINVGKERSQYQLNKYYKKDDALKKVLSQLIEFQLSDRWEHHEVDKQIEETLSKLLSQTENPNVLFQFYKFFKLDRYSIQSERFLLKANIRGHLISRFRFIKNEVGKILNQKIIPAERMDTFVHNLLIPFIDTTHFPPAQYLLAQLILFAEKKGSPIQEESILTSKEFVNLDLELLELAHQQNFPAASFELAQLMASSSPTYSEKIFLELARRNYRKAQRKLFSERKKKNCQEPFNQF